MNAKWWTKFSMWKMKTDRSNSRVSLLIELCNSVLGN